MIAHMKRHEKDILDCLESQPTREELKELLSVHEKQIHWMQHERLVHLLTMLFVCLFFLMALGYTLIIPSLPSMILTALLLGLSVAYIIHYYRLENNVQRWYDLAKRIRSQLIDST